MPKTDNIKQEPIGYDTELNSMAQTIPFFTEMLNTSIYSTEQIKLFVRYPMTYNRQLRRISREMYGLNGIYANTIDYMVSIPSLDFITRCFKTNTGNEKKRQSFNQLLRNINHKLTTRDILMNLFLDGAYVGMIRNSKADNINPIDDLFDTNDMLEGLSIGDNLMIQPLPIDYVKIEGFQNNDYIAAFDMQYFDSFKGNGLQREIKNFPKDFIQAYLNYQKDATKRYYRLNQDKTIVLKFKSSLLEPWGRPLCVSSINDMIFADEYTDAQRENISEVSSNIRWLKQPESAEKGKCSLNKEQQQNQYDNFKSAVFSNGNRSGGSIAKTTTLVLAPGTEVGKLDVNGELLKDTLTKENETRISTGLGFASASLNGAGENGASYASLQVNIDLVMSQIFAVIEQIAFQYTKVINVLLFKKYLIEMIYLRTSSVTKEKDVQNAKDLYTLGGGSRIYWMACAGVDVDAYMSLMDYEKENNFDGKYPPHMTAYTNNGDNGRPTNNNPDNPNTVKSKTNGSNNQPKPSNNQ